MKRLPLKYKKIFKKIFEEDKIEFANDIPHKEIIKIYDKIDELFKKNNCDIYEINSIISSDKINDANSKKFRNFVYLKNKSILKEAANTKLWEQNIKNIMKYCRDTHKIKTSFDLTESAFLKLEKKFVMNWLGFWSTIDINKNGKIKNINVFDMTDYKFIVEYLNKNQ